MFDKISKKYKFIILVVIGGIIIVAAFIWSMSINLSQFSNLDLVPEVSLPEDIPKIIDDIDIESNSSSTELQNITEILEEETNKASDLKEDNNESSQMNTDLDSDLIDKSNN